MGKIRMYADGNVYYVKSVVDVISETIYTGCTNCARMIKVGDKRCPRCGHDQIEDGGDSGIDQGGAVHVRSSDN